MKIDYSQIINTLLILGGGILLIFEISGEEKNVYLLILGIVLLMLGLYRATNHWTITKDDHLEDREEDINEKNS